MKIDVVVGGQFGSEAKGHVTKRLVDRGSQERQIVNVRVAGPNAGHSAYMEPASPLTKFAFRHLPVGVLSTRPLQLVIAPGSEIDLKVLFEEIDLMTELGQFNNKKLWISPSATVIEGRHKDAEAIDRLTERLGSTGKGVGAARADRIMRKAALLGDLEREVKYLTDRGVIVDDYPYSQSEHVIIEGTQGFGLGLHAGYYPYCTSSDCRAVDFLAMAGLHPWGANVDVWVVARMFPIRVAGNSGPLYNETSWQALNLPEERTTVTNKIRRVGMFDYELLRRAVEANGKDPYVQIALTMVDQKWPLLAGKDVRPADAHDLWPFIERVEEKCGARVAMVTTSPHTGFEL